MTTEQIRRAIAFFETYPTGQYDDEAIEALRSYLAVHELIDETYRHVGLPVATMIGQHFDSQGNP